MSPKNSRQQFASKPLEGGARAAVSADSVHTQLGLRAGQSLELLKALHILTAEGKINQDSRRKLKQVNHLTQFLETHLREIAAKKMRDVQGLQMKDAQGTDARKNTLSIADLGAGKSYLGFMLYDLLIKDIWDQEAGALQAHIYGVETRPELVQASRLLAQTLNFKSMTFLNMSALESQINDELPDHIDVVTALHACDSATDDAISFALRKGATFIALVPCCQAEMAGSLKKSKALALARTPLAELWRHPLHTREFGSQITNVLRCLYLESQGYSLTVTELVGWEHSMKNELILARFTGQRKKGAAERLATLVEEFGLMSVAKLRFSKVFESLKGV